VYAGIVRIAAAQIACAVGDIESNVRKIERFARQAHAASATMVLFPEMSDTGYSMEQIRQRATGWKTGAVHAIRDLAKELSLWIVCGVSERENAAIYNSQIVATPDGKIAARYRKTHLFIPEPIREDLCFTPGGDFVSFQADGFKFGLTICYDLRFPELFRGLAVGHETSAFLLSSAWPCPRAHHFRSLAVARAIENQSYFVGANRVGTDDGVQFCGQSVIIDPGGAILASGSDANEELIVADLSVESLNSVRAQMLVFDHRRRDLYA
jgi:predicted amidohydrolase